VFQTVFTSRYRVKLLMELQSRISIIALFSALAISSYVVESIIPRPAPGIRLGIANIFVLIILIHYGFKDALFVGILKSIIGNLIIGQFLTPSFLFSISGTFISILVMTVAINWFRPLSLLGISILGAETHTSTQVFLASKLFLGESSFGYLISPYILLALATGIITGITAYWLYIKIDRRIEFA